MGITPKDPADFDPTMGNYTDLKPFRFWCQKVLPLVYDDSLSYYEVLCKVVDYLNKAMEDVGVLHEDVEDLNTAYQQLQAYVNDYFSTLDVQQEINNKLDIMAEDGTLDALLLPYFNAYKTEINTIVNNYKNDTDADIQDFKDQTNTTVETQNEHITVLESRMDTFSHLTEGSTTGDAELADIRVAADGLTYNTAGDAVRGQASRLYGDVSIYDVDVADPSIANKYISAADGRVTTIEDANFSVTSAIAINDNYYGVVITGDIVVNSSIYILAFYTDNNVTSASSFISGVKPNGNSIFAKIPANAKYMVFASNTDSSSTVKTIKVRKIKALPKVSDIISDVDNLETRTAPLSFRTLSVSYPNNGEYINTNGTISTIPAYPGFKTSNFIELNDNDIYLYIKADNLIPNPVTLTVAFYTSTDVTSFISGVSSSGDPIKVKIPDNANYIRFTNNVDSSGNYTSINGTINIIEADVIKDIQEDVKDIKNKVSYINVSTIPISFTHSGEYINTNGQIAAIPAYQGFKTTDFIELSDTAVCISIPATNIVNNAAILMVAFYSTTDTTSFISGVAPLGEPITALVPARAKYVRFTSNTSVIGNYIAINSDVISISDEVAAEIIKEIGQSSAGSSFKAPEQYDLIVGDTFQLFYKGIIASCLDDNFMVEAAATSGSNYTNMFEITPNAAGNLNLTLNLYDSANNLNDSTNITLKIHSVPSNPAAPVNVLCVGDSLTVHGEWVTEMHRRLTSSGGSPAGFNLSNVRFIGTCGSDVNYEGYGGWTFTSYNTANISNSVKIIQCTHDKTEAEDQHSIYKDANNATWKLETINENNIKIILASGSAANFPASGTLTWVSGGVNHSSITYSNAQNAPANPFWDGSQNKVDFATYAEDIGADSIDYVYVLLGWNSAGSNKNNYKQQAQTFINNVHAAFPDAKIVLMGLQIPARDGLGANYGATTIWSKYLSLVNYVHDLDEWYEELAAANSNVYSINISGQFDTEHNMPTSTRQVNTRNTDTESYQSNGVHPANSGYMQIADAATRSIAGLL